MIAKIFLWAPKDVQWIINGKYVHQYEQSDLIPWPKYIS